MSLKPFLQELDVNDIKTPAEGGIGEASLGQPSNQGHLTALESRPVLFEPGTLPGSLVATATGLSTPTALATANALT